MSRSPRYCGFWDYRHWRNGAVAAACLPLIAAAAPPPFGRLLAAYRADGPCAGPHFHAALHAVNDGLIAYKRLNPGEDASLPSGSQAAAEADALAATAAGRGCKVQALQLWRFVIRYFDGPAFAAYQRQAVAGMRALRG